ncbi:MAG: adenosylcobinamide-GDP ribazoletransferase [Chloroflexi bacterium]|nr:adenosylcobinamide-GDP ribazoletransferase [Chloroflexota bacterium]MCY4247282.1 adenosylcobinamide-GDP ribazoletransferase [Chloroflexota bacterium]
MLDDIRAAFTFLTIIPLGGTSAGRLGRAFAWFPLVGICIGGLLVAVARLSPFDRELTAFLILLAWALVTGGLHLDGFGDCCDGLLAVVAPHERLRIMKDPRVGAFAAAGLMLLLLGKWLAIRAAPIEMLALAPALGRWAMVVAAWRFPSIGDGMAAHVQAGLSFRQFIIASIWVMLLFTQMEIFALALLGGCFTLVFAAWAARRLGGGINGDVCGAVCELTELLCLLAIGLFFG